MMKKIYYITATFLCFLFTSCISNYNESQKGDRVNLIIVKATNEHEYKIESGFTGRGTIYHYDNCNKCKTAE